MDFVCLEGYGPIGDHDLPLLVQSDSPSVGSVIVWNISHSMDSKMVYGILQSFYQNGRDFEEIDIERRRRYAFKLLSLIRGRQYHEFCNNILQLYLTIKKAPTGKNLISLLNQKDEIDFEAKAYAFMSGFLSEESKPKLGETSDVSEEKQ